MREEAGQNMDRRAASNHVHRAWGLSFNVRFIVL